MAVNWLRLKFEYKDRLYEVEYLRPKPLRLFRIDAGGTRVKDIAGLSYMPEENMLFNVLHTLIDNYDDDIPTPDQLWTENLRMRDLLKKLVNVHTDTNQAIKEIGEFLDE